MRPKRPRYEFERFQKAISTERLESYRKRSSSTEIDLLSTHFWNIDLCESLYPAFHNFEIAWRNSIYQAISRLFNPDWLKRADSQILYDDEIELVDAAISKLSREGRSLSTGSIISELHLGFWVSLSYAKHEDLYRRLFKDKDFLPYLPRQKRKRKTLSNAFNSIRKKRNRVFHHKPIWNKPHLKKEYYDCVIETIQWMSPIFYEITKNFSRFPEVYSQGRTAYTKSIEDTMSGYELR